LGSFDLQQSRLPGLNEDARGDIHEVLTNKYSPIRLNR
jgi:hypothetical protein